MDAYDFGKLTIDITPDMVKSFYMSRPTALSSLLDVLMRNGPTLLRRHLDEESDDFQDYILSEYDGGYC